MRPRLIATATAGIVAVGVWATAGHAGPEPTATIAIGAPVNTIRPDVALGAGLDGAERGDMAGVYTRRNLTAMRSAAFPTVAYRLRTELGAEAWHPIPTGRFSAGNKGYWTSSAKPGPHFAISNGYHLPRRGNTIDQANNQGYSRIDDGDPRTFWKSNPYLDPHFTHERHDSWVMVDLGAPKAVDSIRIDWGTPYATRFRVEYWRGSLPPAPYGRERENAIFSSGLPPGEWHRFPVAPHAGHGGAQTIRVARRGLRVQWVRLVLMRSSHTGPAGSRDIRDRLGFAIRELSVGHTHGTRFVDLIRHRPTNAGQTIVWTSSTDPWHRASDLDRNTEQPSFDRVWSSGLTHGRPVLMPVSILYGTPADAVAQLHWLRARHYRVRQVELGEEPDGQMMAPEDYATLYVQFAGALHAVDPHLVLGGPGFSTALPDWSAWPDRTGNRSFTGRFVRYLRSHHALKELGFFSFEWYPVDDVCAPAAAQLMRSPGLLTSIVKRQRDAGLPARVPLMITEFGYSAFAAQPEVDLAGAISNVDTVGQFFALGGRQAYLYGIEPQNVMQESRYCRTTGNLTLFRSDDFHRVKYRLATYWAARMVNRDWVQPGHAAQVVRAAASDDPVVSAYALVRPDGRLSLLMANRDPSRGRSVQFSRPLHCALDVFRLSPMEYRWHARGARPSPDLPPAHLVVRGDALTLPPSSVAVVRTQTPLRTCGSAARVWPIGRAGLRRPR